MDYDLTVSDDGTYLEIRVFRPITGEMARRFAGDAIKEGHKRDIRRFLVDARGNRNVSSVIEQYRLGNEDMAQFELHRLSKIAVVVDEGDTSHDFVETVFRNAGYACSMFSDKFAALGWLGNK